MKIKMGRHRLWKVFDKAVTIYFFVALLLSPLLVASCVTLVQGDYLPWYKHLTLAFYMPQGVWLALTAYLIIPTEEDWNSSFRRGLSLALALTISVFGLSNLLLAIMEFIS